MRELTPLELQSVAGGLRPVPDPRPRPSLRLLVLAILRRIFDPRPGAPAPGPGRDR
jgi:hypothetical protein